ncbi:hypothetical protein BC828DRAFT_381470, partial [Blastocladiella britannica]
MCNGSFSHDDALRRDGRDRNGLVVGDGGSGFRAAVPGSGGRPAISRAIGILDRMKRQSSIHA